MTRLTLLITANTVKQHTKKQVAENKHNTCVCTESGILACGADTQQRTVADIVAEGARTAPIALGWTLRGKSINADNEEISYQKRKEKVVTK